MIILSICFFLKNKKNFPACVIFHYVCAVERILSYFPDLNPAQQQQLGRLPTLYAEWNARINVVSRKDIDELMLHHVLHSLAIAKLIRFKPGAHILDVGTGGGFPGIPLAILFPETDFLLVDSIGKKIKVVQEVAAALELHNVRTAAERAAKIRESFDFIVSRAVTQLPVFLPWVNGKILPANRHALKNGILYLKGGDVAAELAGTRTLYDLYPVSDFFTEEFFREKYVVHIYR